MKPNNTISLELSHLKTSFSGFKSFAILAVANFANINSNEYFCPVGYIFIVASYLKISKKRNQKSVSNDQSPKPLCPILVQQNQCSIPQLFTSLIFGGLSRRSCNTSGV